MLKRDKKRRNERVQVCTFFHSLSSHLIQVERFATIVTCLPCSFNSLLFLSFCLSLISLFLSLSLSLLFLSLQNIVHSHCLLFHHCRSSLHFDGEKILKREEVREKLREIREKVKFREGENLERERKS